MFLIRSKLLAFTPLFFISILSSVLISLLFNRNWLNIFVWIPFMIIYDFFKVVDRGFEKVLNEDAFDLWKRNVYLDVNKERIV